MTLFADTVSKSQKHFPNLTIRYKDQSLLMKILAKIVFFNKDFMNYDTTFGSIIYLPSVAKVKISPVSSIITLLHELSHIYNSQKNNSILFKLSYIFPQILSLLTIPLFFIFGWKALICLLFLLPIPAYFRMREELQAYIMSLYVMNKLNKIYKYGINIDDYKNSFIKEFSSSDYYYMWTLSVPNIENLFNVALEQIKIGGKPIYDVELYDILDNILEG